MLTRSAYSSVWKGIFGIRDLTEIQSGIKEDAKFFDGIRDLTATREARLANVVVRDAVLGKKRKENVIRDIDDKSSGCGIVLKKERKCGIRTPFQTLITVGHLTV